MICSWICGIGMMFEDDIGGIFIAIIGSFWSFNSMYILYGLGELIDKLSLIVDNMMIEQNDDNNSVDGNKVDEINCNCKFNICSNKCDNNFMKFFIMIILLLIVIILLIYLIGNL